MAGVWRTYATSCKRILRDAVTAWSPSPRELERLSRDYYRHGAITLFAVLDISTGQVAAALKPRHPSSIPTGSR
jgi:hypothetical protein